ncbi:MAG: hypothetical protein WKF88_00805 [Ferruginibacter sp.]
MKYGFLSFILFLSFYQVSAYSDTNNIPLSRQSRHDDIRTEQIRCDKLDGRQDWMLRAGSNEILNGKLTATLTRKPNEFRNWIETNDTDLPANNDKVRYLRYVSDVLMTFRVYVRSKGIAVSELPQLLNCFENMMKAKAEGRSVLSYLRDASYPVAKINAEIFTDAGTGDSANAIVYLKYATLNPDKILKTIGPFANEPYADSLIVLSSRINPAQFYSFAQSQGSVIGKLIHNNTDRMVRQVAALSRTDNALFYFPFLDDLLSERQSVDSIKKYVGDGEKTYDSVGYYKLLVRTATAYSMRMAAPLKDTPVAYFGPNGFYQTLQAKAREHFITPINTLHDESNLAVRMRAIQPLGPTDLYYMMVTGENDIFTSSYKHSFNRLLQLMGTKPRGDSLLLSVNFDHFRKFIKMAANYNKLDTFLKTMPALRSEQLMKYFVARLDKSTLEDAVDVADSYSSITDIKLRQSMLENVLENERYALSENNRSGKIIYGLLKTIFLSFDENSKTDLSAQIGIPPIFEVANNYVRDDKGRVIEQVFFYGDKDGKAFYPSFRNSFSPRDWKITDKKEWMEAESLKGNVTVFANKPLESDANLDDTAQVHLANYLLDQGLKPSVIVHRGHSYWLSRTMSRMPGDAKIVLLGSCGGYQNLNEILDINPDAHIISTKEIGTGDINRPILTYINNVITSGADLDWRKMWLNLSKNFSSDPSRSVRESWEDYIPPYKNLGAIFLKAYAKKMEADLDM